MINITGVKISRNWGTRPTDNSIVMSTGWCVQKGEPYDLVQFTIDKIERYYWDVALAMHTGVTEEEARKEIREYLDEYVTEEDVERYKDFLNFGEKYGWD